MAENFKPIRTLERVIPDNWTDYNNHMNETHYLECFSHASDVLFDIIGCDRAYVSGGKSYFTLETHICHLAEVVAGEKIYVTTQVLSGEGKLLRLFQALYHEDHRLLATGEQLFVHVDLATRRSCVPVGEMAEKLSAIVSEHAQLPFPPNAGRGISAK